MAEPHPAAQVPDSHKNAFWIYGVTAMIMREPLAVVVQHLSEEGIHSPGVQVECLRTLVILLILARQFLASGVFFDHVYLQPDSAMRFPRRSYPLDFLTRLAELLVAVAASSAVSLPSAFSGALEPFTILTGILLLLESVWLAVARSAGFSTVAEIEPVARANFLAFLVCAALFGGALAMGFGRVTANVAVLFVAALFTGFQVGGQVRSYDQLSGKTLAGDSVS